eukprot:CAMPEP_0198571426 /NCGR_PEP_ID=MMETSP1462-20131121/110485_1 /TAXON_ID=1333877 /ORGANISM="Brandtodinium nutriculum, Strain RCC3387" /LENGTH=57 /DNA_ID=CAMNT_0044302565 /DNA_START=37 /DNA_END=206 /DNA_ORIENTATION=+
MQWQMPRLASACASAKRRTPTQSKEKAGQQRLALAHMSVRRTSGPRTCEGCSTAALA